MNDVTRDMMSLVLVESSPFPLSPSKYGEEFMRKSFPHQPPEIDEGNREYKLKLTREHKIHKIATQLRFRLYEGEGKALYLLGVSDGGKSWGVTLEQLYDSIDYLQQACLVLTGDCVTMDKIRVYQGQCPKYYVATVRISGRVNMPV
jgi:GTPase